MKILLCFVTGVLFLFSCQSVTEEKQQIPYDSLSADQKRSPEYALAGLKAYHKLEKKLFAAEPLVVNPTNMDIDARGRVWVTEGFNYRTQIHKNNPVKKEGDRIVILEDVDGDGKADTSKVFYQGSDVNAALGIAVLGNKVIVSCSPQVLVLTDTDGDDKADKKEVLFSGIEGVQHDHGVHAFVFGPDGKLYFNFGNEGKKLLDAKGNPVFDKWGAEINHSGNPFRQGMVFRCNIDGSEVEVLGHNFRNNYEVAVDSYGTLWQSDNDDDGNRGTRINYVMEYGNFGYTDELTGAGWRSERTNMHDSIPLRHWYQNDPGSIPNVLQTGAGSPTGMVVYEGSLLPEIFQGQMIHAEPGHNVVRSYPVQKSGAGYNATIVKLVEAKDQWFRPSDVCVAPDGSLLVADWYDPGVGGHGVGDLKQGRIYRLAPKDTPYKIRPENVNNVDAAISALTSPNLALRYLGWNYLDQKGGEVETSLVELWKSHNPIHQARALWLLARLENKGLTYIREAIIHNNPDIRITGIRAARSNSFDMILLLNALVEDDSPQVRREVAIALRNIQSPQAEDLWVKLAAQYNSGDRWYLEALGIGAQNKSPRLYKLWKDRVGNSWSNRNNRDIVWRIRDVRAVEDLIQLIAMEGEPWSDKLRYFRALDFHPKAVTDKALLRLIEMDLPNKDEVLLTTLTHFSPGVLNANMSVREKLAGTLKAHEGTEVFLELVRRLSLKSEMDRVLTLAIDHHDQALGRNAFALLLEADQTQIIHAKLSGKDANIILELLSKAGNWRAENMLVDLLMSEKKHALSLPEILKALGQNRGGQRKIIGLLERGELPAELNETAVAIFKSSGHEDLRKKAGSLLESQEIADGKSFSPISQLVRMKADVANGKRVFEQSCSLCHLVGNKGVDFGPKLTEIGSKLAKTALFKAILTPSEAISFGYEGYDIILKDGTEARGYVSSNTEDYVELTMMGGVSKRLAKSEIKTMTQIEGSLMTSMAMTFEEQDLVDLVGYLQGLK